MTTAPLPAGSTEVPLRWSDALLLGFAPMDRCHAEFVDVVAALQAAPDAELPARLAAVRAHLQSHFAQEDEWMTATGFPARECHVGEHAAVLASVAQVEVLLSRGDTATCRRLADELARWFPGHADVMDAALAHWMCKRRHGGKPLVFRRSLGAGGQPPAPSSKPPSMPR